MGCTNYSDLAHKGYVTWTDGKKQIQDWLNVIDISDFGLMGGEPLLNPEVRDWLIGCRELMPESQLRFTTNGELLHNHLDIIDMLPEIGNIVFKITVHRFDKNVENVIQYIFDKYDWEVVHEYGITRYKTDNNVRFQINRPQTFTKTFKKDYKHMVPYFNDPEESFSNCIQQTCPLLYKGKIYKCSTSGLLPELLERTGNDESIIWDAYKNVPSISCDSSVERINKFIDNFGKPNKICAMCPTAKDTNALIIHQNHIQIKKTRL
jgi:hypothetical protein